MQFTWAAPLVLLNLAAAVVADVDFLVPSAGSSAKGGDVITVHWRDSGNPPVLLDLTRYSLALCAGGDTEDSFEEVATLIEDGVFARGNSVSFQINAGVGSNDRNAYFLKMTSSGPDISVINYSKRFSLTEMVGTFSDRVQQGILSVSDDNGPSPQSGEHDDLRRRQDEAMFAVPYQEQLTGVTRYAPMAKLPGTAITAKTVSRQFPTSAYAVAVTFLPIPQIETTITAPPTFSTSSIENTASPAALPNNMQKFLRRWQDSE
jgi:hypothetical protein